MKFQLTNDFHNSSIWMIAPAHQHTSEEHVVVLSSGQARRARRALCGTRRCACSGETGICGRQETPGGKKLIVTVRHEQTSDCCCG